MLHLPRVTLGFAGVSIRLRPADAGTRFALTPPHDAFVLGDDAPVDCDLEVAFGDPVPSPGPARFSAAGHWELRALPSGAEEVCFFGRVLDEDPQPLTVLTLDSSLSCGWVTQRPLVAGGRSFRVGFPLDEYVAARLLARVGAVVLHATAVVDGSGAVVFAGHSGAGKSTIAKLAEACGAEVLSDDRTILTVDDRGVRAHGTPWHGTLERGSARSAPVRALYVLAHAPFDRIEPLPEAAGLAELYVRVIQPSVDAGELESVLDALQLCVARVPISRLHFRPTAAAYELARGAAQARVW